MSTIIRHARIKLQVFHFLCKHTYFHLQPANLTEALICERWRHLSLSPVAVESRLHIIQSWQDMHTVTDCNYLSSYCQVKITCEKVKSMHFFLHHINDFHTVHEASSLQLSKPTNGSASHMNYVIQLFSPCSSNRWAAVEQPVCMAGSCIRLHGNVFDNNPDRASSAHMRASEVCTSAPRSAEA